MDIKRKAARGIAVLAVALAAGHLVQNMSAAPAPKPVASAELAKMPVKVETVAAGPEKVSVEPAPAFVAPDQEDVAPVAAAPAALSAVAPFPVPVVAPVTEPATIVALGPANPAVTPPNAPAQTKGVLNVPMANDLQPADPAKAVPAAACDTTLDLLTEANAMIGITLLAPCHPNQRVVLRHAGLAVTAQTTSTGALLTAIPALEVDATVELSFADGTDASGTIAVPDVATLRRFGVQWQADDAFQVHSFENAAAYGAPGHVSAANPHRPAVGMQATGGFLSLLGDAATENPLLAEVYTFPADPTAKPEVVVEAAVTDKTCARELLAETLSSSGGSVFVTDLTLAMPECHAVGDYLVLKNLFLDLNMASLN
jgi:hypothetical protein